MSRVFRPVIPGGGPTKVVELVGGPLCGQRWRLPAGSYEFGLSTSPGTISVYRGEWPEDRLSYVGDEPDPEASDA